MMKLSIATAALALAVTGALAKGHDQSGNIDDTPGQNTFMETVVPAQGLGEALGRKGDKPGQQKAADKPATKD